ncbi:MAG: ATP-dependent DNA helicase [Elusimicrobia bacterium]|nr:ATP-dependent DNA helicase [Elusimicrobiota bacterium]
MLAQLFAPDGILADVSPRYETRPQQLKMAEAVAEALEGESRLVVEAGTGVGKSLAYLLPGALWAAQKGKRLLVSTCTRALQEQILEKELPLAAEAMKRLGLTLRYAMLQGADNYLCLRRLERLAASAEPLPQAQRRALAQMASWARSAETAHRSSMPCLVSQAFWSRVSRDPELCPAGAARTRCLYRKDRERAESSHILVVNHALLLSGARLPPYDAIVIDEAHSFEESAVSHYGVAVSSARWSRLAEDLRPWAAVVPDLGPILGEFERAGQAFFAELAREHGFSPGAKEGGRLLSQEKAPPSPGALTALESALIRELEAQGSRSEADEASLLELHSLQGKASALRADLVAILGEESESTARWVEWSGGAVELRSVPLEVGSRLEEGLWSREIPAVMTSATLSSGNGLGEFKSRVGFSGARELVLDSPYDYESQAGLLILEDLPEPAEGESHARALARACLKIVRKVPGGVFLLFSSWRMLRAVHEEMKGKLKKRPLWVQGRSGHEALLSDFMKAGNAVLLGVDTFWQGVDVPGEALSCVVLAKLPFPNFASPMEEARRAWHESLGRSYFDSHSLPRAVMKFRQGFGRLIRSSTDRGAVVVLDPRIVRRSYGEAFLGAIPRCRKLASLEELGEFLSQGGD